MEQPDASLLASASALLQPLLRDPKVLAIYVDGTAPVYAQRGDAIVDAGVTFESEAQLAALAHSLAAAAGALLDERHPIAEFRHPSGLLVVAAIPPLAAEGPTVVIRKPPPAPVALKKLVDDETLSPPMLQFLEAVLKVPVNLIVAGNRGSDRASFLASLLGAIPAGERLALVERFQELRVQRPRLVRLQAQSARGGDAKLSYGDVLDLAARLHPDRLVASELPADELSRAVALASEGQTLLATMHATSPADVVARLEAAMQWAQPGVGIAMHRRFIATSVDLIVQRSRLPDGSRRIVSIAQVGVEHDELIFEDIFAFRITSMQRGHIVGTFESTGIVPRVESLLRSLGIELSQRLFKPGVMEDLF